jgi:hypothetical protein
MHTCTTNRLPNACGPPLSGTQPPVRRTIEPLSPRIKVSEREANHLPSYSAEVKNEWSCTSTPPHVFIWILGQSYLCQYKPSVLLYSCVRCPADEEFCLASAVARVAVTWGLLCPLKRATVSVRNIHRHCGFGFYLSRWYRNKVRVSFLCNDSLSLSGSLADNSDETCEIFKSNVQCCKLKVWGMNRQCDTDSVTM